MLWRRSCENAQADAKEFLAKRISNPDQPGARAEGIIAKFLAEEVPDAFLCLKSFEIALEPRNEETKGGEHDVVIVPRSTAIHSSFKRKDDERPDLLNNELIPVHHRRQLREAEFIVQGSDIVAHVEVKHTLSCNTFNHAKRQLGEYTGFRSLLSIGEMPFFEPPLKVVFFPEAGADAPEAIRQLLSKGSVNSASASNPPHMVLLLGKCCLMLVRKAAHQSAYVPIPFYEGIAFLMSWLDSMSRSISPPSLCTQFGFTA